MLSDAISYTTASIHLTQDASFTKLDYAEGLAMLIDTDHSPTGGFYVMDTWNNNAITISPIM